LSRISGVAIILLFSFSCKKEDDKADKYSFIKVHYDWGVDSYSQVTSSTTTSGNITIYLQPIEKNSVVVFEGETLSPYQHQQSDTSFWSFTPGGYYNGPYNGSELEYFPSNDSISYSKWYGCSHTSAHYDNYYGKKIN
jgi:hypothetical protein